MSFLDLFRKKKKQKVEVSEEIIKPVQLTDPRSISHYVVELCEQMIDISKEMEEVRREYEQVTSYFNDISIIEGLEGSQKETIEDVATSVYKLSKARHEYLNAEHKISDEMFNLLDDNEAEMPGIIKRLKSNEEYLDAIKRDMNRLSGEKIEWSVLRQERARERKKLRKLSFTMLYVLGTAAIVIAAMSMMLQWDLLPLMVVALLAVVVGSYIVIRMQECTKEIKRCDINLNRAIALENRVKIKYVNIKNAVDYTCERFHVSNAMELTYNYEQYIEACKERERFKQTTEDLEYFNGRLVRLLNGLDLYDARIWVNYAEAIIEPKEMVEVKHDLFGRRQKLRSRIEYNLSAIEDMKQEVEKYIDFVGEREEQIRQIISRVDAINKGNTP